MKPSNRLSRPGAAIFKRALRQWGAWSALVCLIACGGGDPTPEPTADAAAKALQVPPSDALCESQAEDTPVIAEPQRARALAVQAPMSGPACTPWTSPQSWGGAVPNGQTVVTIPADRCITLDTSPPALAGLVVRGTLRFDDSADRSLTSRWIVVDGGALEIGLPTRPFQHTATITLNDTDRAAQAHQGMGTRGLLVMGGRLALYGRRPAVAWTRIAGHLAAGASDVLLARAVQGWQPGDELALAPTDFYGVAATERLRVGRVASSGAALTLSTGVTAARWGRLQFPDPGSPQGLSLAPAAYTPPAAPAPVQLDERAEIGNLTRGIVIQAPDDALWRTQGFGAHTMIMGATSRVDIDGVQFRRVGQAGLTGRYPMHWHMLSYVSGVATGDASGHALRNSVIDQSAQRCIAIHGTNGVTVRNNICHDIRGHAVFLEDAVERRNVIEDNLVLRVRDPLPGRALLNHDITGSSMRSGPSGFWITHPDNIIRRNVVADAQGNGYWYALPRRPIGQPDSRLAPLAPVHATFGVFEGNTAHSVNQGGLLFDLAPVATPPHSDVEGIQYLPTANQQPPSETNRIEPFRLGRFTTWKNRDGFWNRLNGGNFEEFVSADNTGRFFAGSSALSTVRRSLVVGTSLNRTVSWETLATDPRAPFAAYRALRAVEPPAAFASYHGGVAVERNTVINMPFIDAQAFTSSGTVPSGAFGTDDYYLRPVERSLAQNTGNLLIASAPGRRSVPVSPHFVFAGAVVDYEGLFGPAGNSWVFDTPFLTHGGGCVPVAPQGRNGQSCAGDYFGAEAFVLDNNNDEYYPLMALSVSRRAGIGAPDAEVGTWSVQGVPPQLAGSYMLPNMRHFAMRAQGVYELTFPGYRDATQTDSNRRGPLADVRMTIGNMHRRQDAVTLAVEFHGAQANVFTTTFSTLASSRGLTGALSDATLAALMPNSVRRFTRMGTRAQLLAATGDAFFHDVAARRVWIRITGGLADAHVGAPGPFSDETLYQPFYLRIND